MPLLIAQLTTIAILLIAIAFWAANFPNPSPFIKPFLNPKLRWPEKQIRYWLSVGRINKSYLRFFNRDPDRNPPEEPGLVAPADGLITSTAVCDGIRYVVIALSFWDIHVQRCPSDGKVLSIVQHGETFMDGEGRDFAFLKDKPCPVQSRIEFDAKAYGAIAVRLITSLAARRIETWVNANSEVERGQRLGRILLGSTVVLEMNEKLALNINVGDRVVAGQTIVANHAHY